MMRLLMLLLAGLLASALPAAAEPLKVRVNGAERVLYKERHALLIGASKYTNGWDALDNVGNELAELQKALVAQEFTTVTVMMDLKGRDLYEKIRSFILEKGAPDSAIMIVYSGHGWTSTSGPNKTGYIVPIDAPNPSADRATFMRLATSMPELRLLADQSEAMHTFFVFDSCFSGSIFISRGTSEPKPAVQRQDVAWYETLKSKGVQFLTSGDENQRVPAVSRFMPAFIAGIQGEGGADDNGDGLVSAKDLGRYFTHSVAITPQKPKFGDIGDYARDGDFMFRTPKRRVTTSNASSNDPNAIFNRAYALENGVNVMKNEADAAKMYRAAADENHFGAQANLGRMYRDGRGVQQNHAEAVRWFTLAAVQGDPWAQSLLGSMYDYGQGVAQDHVEAIRWYRKSADQGFAAGQNNLAVLYDKGFGVAQDHTEAVRLYRLSAEQGDANAQNNLGVMYQMGRGVAQDDAEAVRWYRLAAEQGDAYAQNNLGMLYQMGRGVAQDAAEAERWYRLAAEQGNASAQNNLAKMYEMYEAARGVSQDLQKASAQEVDPQGNRVTMESPRRLDAD
jgi:TPR repeat protein